MHSKNIALSKNFLVLMFCVGIIGLGFGTSIPITTLALREFGYSSATIGLLTALQAGGGLLITPFIPALSRAFSLKNIILSCLALLVVSVIPMQFSNNLIFWGILKIINGAATSLLFALTETWINQLATENNRGRLVGLYATCYTFFQLMGPIFVDSINHLTNYRFLICGGAFLLAFPALLLTRQFPTAQNTSRISHSWRKVLLLMPALVIGTSFFALLDTLALSLFPIYALEQGISTSTALFCISVILLGDTLLQIPIGWYADKIGHTRMHFISGICTAILLASMPWYITHDILRWPLLFLLGAFSGSIYMLSVVGCGQRFQGMALVTASSIIVASWNISSFGGPLITGALMKAYSPNVFVILLLVIIIAFLISLIIEQKILKKSRTLN